MMTSESFGIYEIDIEINHCPGANISLQTNDPGSAFILHQFLVPTSVLELQYQLGSYTLQKGMWVCAPHRLCKLSGGT